MRKKKLSQKSKRNSKLQNDKKGRQAKTTSSGSVRFHSEEKLDEQELKLNQNWDFQKHNNHLPLEPTLQYL